MWAQTYKNGNRYYREHRGSRGAGYCVDRSGSISCDIPDEQVGRIISAIVLPEAWLDRVLTQVHLADEVKRVEREKAQVYVDGHVTEEEYRRQKKQQKEKLRSLIVPDANAAVDAGKLLENLGSLWEKADLGERWRLLTTMLDAVNLDTVEKKRLAAIWPKPAFRHLLEVATTREASDIVLAHDVEEGSNPVGQSLRNHVSPRPEGKRLAFRVHGGDGGELNSAWW